MKNLLLVSLTCLVSASFAQDKATPKDPITTDRPDFTESSVVVPYRWLQIESGFTYQASRSAFSFGAPEILARYGFSTRAELRVGLPNYNHMRADKASSYGYGDSYLGIKYQIGPLRNGDDMAIIPAVSIPSNDKNFSSTTLDPEVKLCWSRDLGSEWTVSAMAYGLWTTDTDKPVFVYQQTVSFGKGIADKLAVFMEYAGTFSKIGMPDHVAHVGIVYQPTANTQFDIHGGASVNGQDRSPFIAAGYSIRF